MNQDSAKYNISLSRLRKTFLTRFTIKYLTKIEVFNTICHIFIAQNSCGTPIKRKNNAIKHVCLIKAVNPKSLDLSNNTITLLQKRIYEEKEREFRIKRLKTYCNKSPNS